MISEQIVGKNKAIRLMNEYGSERKPFLFIISFTMEQCLVIPAEEIDPEKILYQVKLFSNSAVAARRDGPPEFRKFPVEFETYRKRFLKVRQEISLGNTYLINLTCPTKVETTVGLRDIFHYSNAKYKLWFDGQFVVFSPETFVTIRNGHIASFPMKGTIDASIPDAEHKILNDPKEVAEHYTIVDLIRNDLNSVSKKVKVNRFRYVERLETNFGTLLQVSSEISGQLKPDYQDTIGDILFGLLPAGSVSGAPKERTVKIILDSEEYDRGFYTGVFGYFDGENLDSGVMIRFLEISPHGLIFKSGGGITSFSDPEAEYREMVDKVYLPFNR